jgi:hypothetical protein
MYRRAARESFRSGAIDKKQYEQLISAARHPFRKRLVGNNPMDLMEEIEKYTNENMPKEGKINWETIIQWLKDHWMDILKLVISLSVFLEPVPQDK